MTEILQPFEVVFLPDGTAVLKAELDAQGEALEQHQEDDARAAMRDQLLRQYEVHDEVKRIREEAAMAGDLTADAEAFYALRLKPKLTEAHDFTPKVKTPVVQNLFNKNSLCWVVGSSGTFKSFVTADLAFRYGAEDMDYHGRKMTHGRSLIIVAEGADGYAHRKTAWEKEHNRTVKDVVIYPGALQLADVRKEMAALVHHLKEEEEAGRPYGLIMVDTQAMCTVGVDENKSEMNLVINVLHRIREVSGACVLVVHHFGKDERKGMRGSSMLYAAADTVLVLKRKEDAMDVTLSTAQADEGKQKEGINEKDFLTLELKSHVVGEDYFGDPVSSLVPIPAQGGGTDIHDHPVGIPQSLPPVTEIEAYYLRGIGTYEEDGAAPASLRERLEQPEYMEKISRPSHSVTRQTAGNRLQDLKKKGLTEPVPGAKGKWRITPLGVAVTAQLMIDRLRTEADWADRNARRGRFRGPNTAGLEHDQISGSPSGSPPQVNQSTEPREPERTEK